MSRAKEVNSYTSSPVIQFISAKRLIKCIISVVCRCPHPARRWGAVLITFIALSLRSSLASSLHCAHSSGPSSVGHNKWLSSDAYSGVVVDCRARSLTRVPRYTKSNVTELDLSRNNISTIGQDDFVNMTNLRILVLANSFITTLENHCFRHLIHLEQLAFNDNDITSLQSGVFVGLHSLRVLTMTGLFLTSYPTQFVSHTRELRVLSLGIIGDSIIPAKYARLPRLEVLDFNGETQGLAQITAAMFDNIRDSNIATMSFRNIAALEEFEAGAFSNLPNLRSLVISCNRLLSYRVTMESLVATTNTTVDTVVLDGITGIGVAIFDEADFCSPFWRTVQRLSIKCAHLVGFVFNHAGCLSKLRQVSLDYNALTQTTPLSPDFSVITPFLRTISFSHMGWCTDTFHDEFCFDRYYLLDADDYFPMRPPVLATTSSLITNNTDVCNDKPLSVANIRIPASVEFFHIADVGLNSPRKIEVNACTIDLRMRYLNISMNKFTKVLGNEFRLIGGSRLEIVDASHGAVELITPEFMQNFKNLRFLNLSHNVLGASGSDYQGTFSQLPLLEDINLSYNKLGQISPRAFELCTNLRRLNLANNELTHIDMYMGHLSALELIDLRGNRLVTLSDTFMRNLDEQFHVRPLVLNIQREMFACNCESVSFVRWMRMTHVRLTGKDQLTCSYGDLDKVRITEIVVEHLEAGCHVSVLPIVAPIIAVVILISIGGFLVRYHRWYIKYHLVLCWLRDGRTFSSTTGKEHDAMVTYFLHASNSRDQQGGVARISRWVCTRLLPRAEDEWGLRLYVGDRDDVGGASKMHNFVRGFESSDKVVVCLTREFIDDTDCMNYLATALDSSKPLSKYIFVLFDEIQLITLPRRLRQLLLPNAPSVLLTWGDIEVDDMHAPETFWRRMRDALMRDPDQERCRRHFDVIPLLMSQHSVTDNFGRQ